MISLRMLGVGKLLAILVTVLALPVAVQVIRPWRPLEADDPTRVAPQEMASVGRPDSLDEKVIARDPFRPSRRPAEVSFDPNPITPPPAEPPPPKPALVVSGIMWGREPSAVLEGLPGVEGARLVRSGEVLAGFRIRRITPNEVTVTGMDTTWVLKVRKPW